MYKEVFELLNKAARYDRCDWGYRERAKQTGILTPLPEIDDMRVCGRLLAVRARLAIAEGRFEPALTALRTGFAMARHTGETEALLSFLFGAGIAADMQKQLDTFIAQPGAPSLYYGLTDLPTPLLNMRKSLDSERFAVYSMFPDLVAVAADRQAGNLAAEKLEKSLKTLADISDLRNSPLDRIRLAQSIRAKHETAKKVLIADGRPKDKVEAMPHLQVALLHALLEYDAAFDEQALAVTLPYWEQHEPLSKVAKRISVNRTTTADAPAIELAVLMDPHVERSTLASAGRIARSPFSAASRPFAITPPHTMANYRRRSPTSRICRCRATQ